MLPALEKLSKELPGHVVEELTKELSKSDWYRKNRTAVCRDGGWVFRWRADGPKWERIGPDATVLEIPAFEDHLLPGQALPGLGMLGPDIVVTLQGRPALLATDAAAWPLELLATMYAATDATQLLREAAALDYFLRFAELHAPVAEAGAALATRLGSLSVAEVRGQESDVRSLLRCFRDDARDLARKAIAHLPIWPAVPVHGGKRERSTFLSADELQGEAVFHRSGECLAAALTQTVDGLRLFIVEFDPQVKPLCGADAACRMLLKNRSRHCGIRRNVSRC